MKSRFNRAIATRPWHTMALFLVLTAVLSLRIPATRIETDIWSMMPRNDPVYLYNEWLEEYFGIEDPGVILVVNEGVDGVFTPQTLSLVDFLSESMAGLEAIDGEDLISLSTVDNITADGDSLVVDTFFDIPPETSADAQAIREAVFDNPMMVGTVVSDDGKATAIIGEIYDGYEKERLYQDLRAIVARAPISGERVLIAGQAVIEGQLGLLSRRDMAFMFPLVLLTAGVAMFLSLRSLRGAALPLLVVFLSVVWTLGAIAWTDSPLYPVTTIIPVVLVAIGVAAGIHIIHRFLLGVAANPTQPVREIVLETVEEMTKPVIMTSLTTAGGVGALAISTMPAIRSFGVFTAVGVMATMVFSLTILPALLCVLPLPLRAARRTARLYAEGGSVMAQRLGDLTRIVTRRPLLPIACGLGLVVAGLSGIPHMIVDGSILNNFPPSNPVRVADGEFVTRFGGSLPMEVIVDGGGANAWKAPDRLRAVEALQRHIEASEYAGETRSIVDYIKRMNAVMNPTDPNGYRIPDSRDLIAQYLLLYSMSGEPDDFDDVVDYDYKVANVRVQLSSDRSAVAQYMIDEVEAYADKHLVPLGITVRVGGTASTLATFLRLLTESQTRGVLIAVILIACLTAFMCGSVLGGLLTAIPVTVATVINFGVLGWSGEPLGVTTALMSALAIGIGVDFAIHFVVTYQNLRQHAAAPELAMRNTLNTVGIAIFYNCLVVVAGFLVLATSEFLPNRVLGLLVSLNMVVCMLGTVTLLAALLHRLQPAFVRPRFEKAAERTATSGAATRPEETRQP
ncbi:MAG: RND family transporter [Candidatus Binatia bacterium]